MLGLNDMCIIGEVLIYIRGQKYHGHDFFEYWFAKPAKTKDKLIWSLLHPTVDHGLTLSNKYFNLKNNSTGSYINTKVRENRIYMQTGFDGLINQENLLICPAKQGQSFQSQIMLSSPFISIIDRVDFKIYRYIQGILKIGVHNATGTAFMIEISSANLQKEFRLIYKNETNSHICEYNNNLIPSSVLEKIFKTNDTYDHTDVAILSLEFDTLNMRLLVYLNKTLIGHICSSMFPGEAQIDMMNPNQTKFAWFVMLSNCSHFPPHQNKCFNQEMAFTYLEASRPPPSIPQFCFSLQYICILRTLHLFGLDINSKPGEIRQSFDDNPNAKIILKNIYHQQKDILLFDYKMTKYNSIIVLLRSSIAPRLRIFDYKTNSFIYVSDTEFAGPISDMYIPYD